MFIFISPFSSPSDVLWNTDVPVAGAAEAVKKMRQLVGKSTF